MKKNLLLSMFAFAALSLASCDNAATTGDNATVIDTDTTVSEVQVEKTMVETDTITNTEKVEVGH